MGNYCFLLDSLHVHTKPIIFRYWKQVQGTITLVFLLHIDGAWILSRIIPRIHTTQSPRRIAVSLDSEILSGQ